MGRRHTRLILMNLGSEFIIAVASEQTVLHCNLTVSSRKCFPFYIIFFVFLIEKYNNNNNRIKL